MKTAIINILIIIVILLIGGLPLLEEDIDTSIIFQSPIFVLALFFLSILLFRITWKRKGKSWKYVLFAFVHMGCVIILLGAFLGLLYKKEAIMFVYVQENIPERFLDQMMEQGKLHAVQFEEDEKQINLMEFKIFCESFSVEKYPTDTYRLYRLLDLGQEQKSEFIGKYKITEEGIDLQELGKISLQDLKENNQFKVNVHYKEKYILQLASAIDKTYTAELYFMEEGEKTEVQELSINSPISYKGWKIYLLDYEKEQKNYITISAKKDPGVHIVIIGIWLLLIGITGICYFRPRNKEVL